MNKWLVLGLEQGRSTMSQDHLVMLVIKEWFKKMPGQKQHTDASLKTLAISGTILRIKIDKNSNPLN